MDEVSFHNGRVITDATFMLLTIHSVSQYITARLRRDDNPSLSKHLYIFVLGRCSYASLEICYA